MASTDLNFTTKPKERPEATGDDVAPIDKVVTFTIDGREYQAKRPKDALVARLGPATQRRTNPLLKVSLAMDFLGDCILEPGRTLLTNRLEDEHDDFDVEDALEILEKIAQEWAPQGRRSRALPR